MISMRLVTERAVTARRLVVPPGSADRKAITASRSAGKRIAGKPAIAGKLQVNRDDSSVRSQTCSAALEMSLESTRYPYLSCSLRSKESGLRQVKEELVPSITVKAIAIMVRGTFGSH